MKDLKNDSLRRYFEEAEYKQAQEHCERLIQQCPEKIDYYWHLGLAYLLQGHEEEAQLTWLRVLSQQDPSVIELQTKTLVKILDQEATQQQDKDNYQNAWLIRGHIREIVPSHLKNLIKLIYLESHFDWFSPSKLQEWRVTDYLLNNIEEKISNSLVIKTLKKILRFHTSDTVDFARACLEYSSDKVSIALAIDEIAKEIFYVSSYSSDSLKNYTIELVNLALIYVPNNLTLLRTLFWFYVRLGNYQASLSIGQEFLAKSQDLKTRIFAQYQLLRLYLDFANWQDFLIMANLYVNDLNEFLCNTGDFEQKLEEESLEVQISPYWSHPLFYFQDKPYTTRKIINQLGDTLQNNITTSSFTFSSHQLSLRIGYIASTFRTHSVAWLCRWLLKHHNPDRLSYYLYSVTDSIDEFTKEWFLGKGEKFSIYNTNTINTNDELKIIENITQDIYNDRIDILVDLDSLSNAITCQVMARKPSPIEVTWLGLDASGIPAIDYFIADPYVLPDDAKNYYSERIWRLPNCYLAVDGFEVGTQTITREDLQIDKNHVVFMNTQGPFKLHPDILRLQMQIIARVPDSYFLIKLKDNCPFLKELYFEIAKVEGVSLERLRFIPRTSTELEHRANLSLADIVLDTYPYNGATTTLETLWMEIPIVTKVGNQFAARNSYTFIINAGIQEGIAYSDEEYIEWGVHLGINEDLRRQISWKLRQAKNKAPLWNGKQFAQEMENAYEKMWEIYLKNKE